eukprot:sb/3479747/
MAGRDLRSRVTRDGDLIRTTTYLEREYSLSFRGEDLLHWMISHSWAEDRKESAAIAQLLLTHNVILNVSDTRCLMVFRQCAIYRFREDQTEVSDQQAHDLEATFDNVYRKLWTDWVIRSRMVGWWVYTNTVTGQEFITWLTDNEVTESRDQAIHFASQLLLVNFFIRIYPARSEEGSSMCEFTDDDTIYQVNVCYNQTVDTTTKVMHSLAHAVRLCSTDTEGCMFYGKTELPENVQLENFEVGKCVYEGAVWFTFYHIHPTHNITMLLAVLLSFLLYLPCHGYSYYYSYPLIALPEVFVALDETAELRCSKVIEYSTRYGDHMIYCDPLVDDCYFKWTDSSGNELNQYADPRISVRDFVTNEYCAVLPNSDNMNGGDWADVGRMRCLNSVLKITNVTHSDLVGYKCTVGSYTTWWRRSSGEDPGSGERQERGSGIQERNTDKGALERTDREERIYSEEGTPFEKKVYLKDNGTRIYSPAQLRFQSMTQEWTYGRATLLQCVVGRGEAVWRFRAHDGYYGSCWNTDKYDSCEGDEWMSLEELHALDQYQCFHAEEKRTSTVSGSMSLLRVDQITCTYRADIVVYCLENTTHYETGWDVRGILLTSLAPYMNQWKRLGYIGTGIAFTFTTIPLIFIAAAIVACVRANKKIPATATVVPTVTSHIVLSDLPVTSPVPPSSPVPFSPSPRGGYLPPSSPIMGLPPSSPVMGGHLPPLSPIMGAQLPPVSERGGPGHLPEYQDLPPPPPHYNP